MSIYKQILDMHPSLYAKYYREIKRISDANKALVEIARKEPHERSKVIADLVKHTKDLIKNQRDIEALQLVAINNSYAHTDAEDTLMLLGHTLTSIDTSYLGATNISDLKGIVWDMIHHYEEEFDRGVYPVMSKPVRGIVFSPYIKKSKMDSRIDSYIDKIKKRIDNMGHMREYGRYIDDAMRWNSDKIYSDFDRAATLKSQGLIRLGEYDMDSKQIILYLNAIEEFSRNHHLNKDTVIQAEICRTTFLAMYYETMRKMGCSFDISEYELDVILASFSEYFSYFECTDPNYTRYLEDVWEKYHVDYYPSCGAKYFNRIKMRGDTFRMLFVCSLQSASSVYNILMGVAGVNDLFYRSEIEIIEYGYCNL